jgi:hypothetical protein
MRAVMETAGFRVQVWEDVTQEIAPRPGAELPAHSIQRILMGEALEAIHAAGDRNREEGRIVSIQAVLERR